MAEAANENGTADGDVANDCEADLDASNDAVLSQLGNKAELTFDESADRGRPDNQSNDLTAMSTTSTECCEANSASSQETSVVSHSHSTAAGQQAILQHFCSFCIVHSVLLCWS